MKSLFFIVFCFGSLKSWGLPDRIVTVDLGVTFPQLSFIQGEVLAWKHWQLGLGLGMLPDAAFPTIKLREQTFSITDGVQYLSKPSVRPNLSSLTPFIRYFPGQNNFYLQVSYTMLRFNAFLKTTLQSVNMPISTYGILSGSFSLTQTIPTFSIGNLFMGKVYFFNVSLGASVLSSIWCRGGLDGLIPDLASDSVQSELKLKEMGNQMCETIVSEFNKQKTDIIILPSIALTFGISL